MIKAAFHTRLRAILAPEDIRTLREDLEPYAHDETEDLRFWPEVAVLPRDTAQVSAILALATEFGVPVTPRGGGTGLSGGALAVQGGIVLSLERMNRILEIDRENYFVRVQPGVIVETLHNALTELGLFYPPDPASKASCMIGGNLAECAGGPRAVKYGVTRDYVYGLEAVLASGEVIRLGGKLLKNATGYDLIHLLVGSEGTLAVITEATLRILPLPACRATLMVPFPTLESAAGTVPAVFAAGIVPSACEFMEHDALRYAEEHLQKSFPGSDAAAMLLFEVDGPSDELVLAQAERIAEICMENGAPEVMVADSPVKQEELWAIRRSVGEAVKKRSVYKEEDTVVPRSALPALVRGVKAICARYGIHSACYGHAGDGNLHVNLLRMDASDEVWRDRLPEAIREIFALTLSLGGTISGEHGIGWSQRAYVGPAFDDATWRLMRELKRVFDPQGILNPGKIFPEESHSVIAS